MRLEDGISKKQWIEVVSWLNFRWDNAKLDDEKIKALYPDFAQFPEDVMWRAMQTYYDSGSKFFNIVELRKICIEEYNDYLRDLDNKQKALGMGEVMRRDKGGLIEYLKLNGYESFAHAVWDVTMKRIRSGKATPTDDLSWDTEEDWTSAKASWTQMFGKEMTIEQLEKKREEESKPKTKVNKKRSVYNGD